MIKWTDEQLQAILARDSNLLVTAAAGSGKTAVLVERIIRMIGTGGLNIDNLLVVTFTNAAAGEMRQKITTAILKQIETASGSRAEHLRRQLQLIGSSSICTLHAFCTAIVRENFHQLDIDPKFRIGDTAECSILRLEAVEEVLEEAYAAATEGFHDLVERFATGKSDKTIENLILRTFFVIQSQPQPLIWLKEKIDYYGLSDAELANSVWATHAIADLQLRIKAAAEFFMTAETIIDSDSDLEGYRPALQDDISLTRKLLAALQQGLPAFVQAMQALSFTRLGRVKKGCEANLQEKVKELRNEGKKIIQDLDNITQGKSMNQLIVEIHSMYPALQALLELVGDFINRYQEKKADKGILDFDDLEHFALQVLNNPDTARLYREKYHYIFVDEYQDSNLVQETLLNYIKGEHNLFMVGDVKQSIYRFRLADPTLFLSKYQTFNSDHTALNRRIDLSKNFRSRREILDGVNYIFKNIMSTQLGEIDYDLPAYLYYGSQMPALEDARIEVQLIEKDTSLLEFDEDNEELTDVEIEAAYAARRIKQLLGQNIFDPRQNCLRPLQYRDIVILMRATQTRADVYLELLAEQGIPVYADVNSGYFASLEIEIFINLLRIVDNKKQDIPLLSVLRSPLGKFSVQDLIDIRLNSSADYMYQAVEDYLKNQEDDLSRRLAIFWGQLRNWQDKARFMPIEQLIWEIMLETDYFYYVSAMPGGIQRQANLRILLERARQFQASSLKGLYNFISFIDSLQSGRGGDMGNARIMGEEDNVVRIMSIHKSKGLEFPVVILAGLGKQFNFTDTNAAVMFHKDLGIGTMFVDPEARIKSNSLPRAAIQNVLKNENLSEEMRILYVGCTRAINKLIMLGSLKNLPALVKKWSRSLNPYGLSRARTVMDWIGPVLLQHRDGQILRDLLEEEFMTGNILNDDSVWDISIVSPIGLTTAKREVQLRQESLRRQLSNFHRETESPQATLINRRLNWDYPYREAEAIPSKLSVSSIKKNISDNWPIGLPDLPQLLPAPDFITNPASRSVARLSGAEKGTIMHFVMQHLDLARVSSNEEIKLQLQGMLLKELLTPEEVAAVETDKIMRFFTTALGQRMLQSPAVNREVPFNLVCPAAEVLNDIKGEEDLLVQGVIDLYFSEGDELVLVDYKTDYVSAQNRNALIHQYSIQVDLYKRALEAILNKKVKESYLYLFHTDEMVAMGQN